MNAEGSCLKCVSNFELANGVCRAKPVGYAPGSGNGCLSEYISQDGSSCFRRTSDLRLLSSRGVRGTFAAGTQVDLRNRTVIV